MRKLHAAIRNGFHGVLSPVDRQTFRSTAQVESSIVIIPINFFLHNRYGHLSVDELVFQAINSNHSTEFDRLALFSLNLSCVGSGRDTHSRRKIVSRPAMWANEFVRERLWSQGTWQADALQDTSLDTFLQHRMNAQRNVREKCRNNYRHMFELCKYWTTDLPVINSGAGKWIRSALFLVWDRHILDGGAKDRTSLLNLVDIEELYKLLGMTRDHVLEQADLLVCLYENVGHTDRFQEDAVSGPTEASASPTSASEFSEETAPALDWYDQEESDIIVERRSVERREHRRNRKMAAMLKRHYNNTCQFCGTQLPVSENQFYSESAHIKALGEPHNGPDKVDNMLVLCPNHHLQFDRGVLRLYKVGTGYRIRSKMSDDPLNGRSIVLKHALDDDHVTYHHKWFS